MNAHQNCSIERLCNRTEQNGITVPGVNGVFVCDNGVVEVSLLHV